MYSSLNHIYIQVEKKNDLCSEGGMGSAEIEKQIDCPLLLALFFLLALVLLTQQKARRDKLGVVM